MKERFIDRFEVILLDMGRTFMFGVDRFDRSDDFETSYRNAGGGTLNANEVFKIASTILKVMIDDGKNPAKYEAFPSVKSYLDTQAVSCDLGDDEKKILEKVIAEHEIGTIPLSCAETIKELAKTHRLGVVSDVWSNSRDYLLEFERVGIDKLFETAVFSSDIGIIKPSSKIFQKAFEALGVDKSRVVYIGDSLRRDVGGAKSFGIAAIWIQGDQVFDESIGIEPDLTVGSLEDVLRRGGF